MIQSVNEVEMLVLKAARGSGLPLAQAQDVARALVASGAMDAFQDFLDLANQQNTASNVRFFNEQMTYETPNILADAPIAARTVASGACQQAVFEGCDTGPMMQAISAFFGVVCTQQGSGCVLTATQNPQKVQAKRLTVSDQILADLGVLAAKTYVPETDASRLAGAGAGLTDND